MIVSKSNIPVGIFIDKGFLQTDRVFVPALSDKDEWLIPYLEKLRNNSGSVITIADIKHNFKKASPIFAAVGVAGKAHKDPIHFVTEEMIEKDFLQQQDLMVISEESWRKLVESKSLWLADMPSTLILARK